MKDGNLNLVKNKNGYGANETDERSKDIDDKQLWDSLKKHLNKRIKEYLTKSKSYTESPKDVGMYGDGDVLQLIRKK